MEKKIPWRESGGGRGARDRTVERERREIVLPSLTGVAAGKLNRNFRFGELVRD